MRRHPSAQALGPVHGLPMLPAGVRGRLLAVTHGDGCLQRASVVLTGSLRHLGSVQVSWRSSVAFVGPMDPIFKLQKIAAYTLVVCGSAVSLEDVFLRAASSFLSVVLLFRMT